MKENPFIVSEIILKAVQHLQDAQYDHHAEIVLGENSRTFVLVDEDEFKELMDFLDEERGWEDYPRDFESIVKTPHCDSALSLSEESEGS